MIATVLLLYSSTVRSLLCTVLLAEMLEIRCSEENSLSATGNGVIPGTYWYRVLSTTVRITFCMYQYEHTGTVQYCTLYTVLYSES